MTAKLKTMLLPTGEFALIATGFERSQHASLTDFRKQVGAAGCVVSDDEIDVENAPFGHLARRAAAEPEDDDEDPEQLPETDETHIFFPAGKFVNIGQLNPKDSQSFSVEFTAQQSPEFARVLFGSTVTEGDDQHGATFGPAVPVVDGEKTTAGLEPEQLEVLPPKPAAKPGDQVRVNGLSWGGERYHGSVGTFLRVRDGKNCVVQFDGIPGTRTFDLDQLEPLIEPKLDFPIDYSQDSRLVDIVSRLRYNEARLRGNMGWPTWGDQKDGIKRIWRSDTERQLRELSS